MVVSEWVIPVSEVAGPMADVSDAGAASLFSQPASRRTAVNTRIVFIVSSSEKVWVHELGTTPVTVAGQRRAAKVRYAPALSR
jgi:hypothetical protein